MEHIIASNIMQHLEKNNILYDLQHSFRKSRSCETKLLHFVQELTSNYNKNIQTVLIIMDFDKDQHLLYKLNFYGIQNQTLNWIKAFLSDHTQTVVINGTSSNTAPVASGGTRAQY